MSVSTPEAMLLFRVIEPHLRSLPQDFKGVDSESDLSEKLIKYLVRRAQQKELLTALNSAICGADFQDQLLNAVEEKYPGAVKWDSEQDEYVVTRRFAFRKQGEGKKLDAASLPSLEGKTTWTPAELLDNYDIQDLRESGAYSETLSQTRWGMLLSQMGKFSLLRQLGFGNPKSKVGQDLEKKITEELGNSGWTCLAGPISSFYGKMNNRELFLDRELTTLWIAAQPLYVLKKSGGFVSRESVQNPVPAEETARMISEAMKSYLSFARLKQECVGKSFKPQPVEKAVEYLSTRVPLLNA